MSLKLPTDFAKKIAETLNWKMVTVDEFLDFSEDKQGYFWAKLKPKKFLDKPDFQTLCRLAKDLGGEGYLQGSKAWMVPGALAKKPAPATTQKDHAPSESTPKQEHASGESIPKEPFAPIIRFIDVAAITVPSFLPTREEVSSKRLEEIKKSIEKHGLKYPLRVRCGPEPESFELIDGFVRLQSVEQLGWKKVQAVVVKDASDQEVVIESIITNKDRIEEDPITVAKKLDILINAFGYTQEKLAEDLGIDRTAISHYGRLLRLPKEVQHSVALHNVSFYHALLLLTVEKPELQTQLAKEVVDQSLSTRQLEQRIQEAQPKPALPIGYREPQDLNEGKKLEEQARAQGVCARCGSPETTHPIDGKFYCDACAELIEAENEPSVVPSAGPVGDLGVSSERAAEGPHEEAKAQVEHVHRRIEGVQVGEFTCPECKQKFFIDHVSASNHKLTLIREAPE